MYAYIYTYIYIYALKDILNISFPPPSLKIMFLGSGGRVAF